MFSVEFEHDEVCITVMDETGQVGDLKVHSFDDVVYIVQDDENLESSSVVEITPVMWEELLTSVNTSEGFYMRKRSK
jgi:hypothetical protein